MSDYRGMSYVQASHEAARLIEQAHQNGRWWDLVEKLQELRSIMKRQMANWDAA